MTFYFTQTPYVGHRPWARRWMDAETREAYCDLWIPVDVQAEDDAYILTASIPGANAEDVNIQVVNETVTIQGEIKAEKEESKNYLINERPSGKFSRVISLPDSLDAAKAEANFTNGVLTLRLPKSEEAKPKSIKVVAK
ncbi:MAG: Hsp20/alpha crystallin family protein [Leptolinea sp.]|jgi:HSP20 family protein|nr:Hsp20/alpha crystallin family protein [Leptolinea sp.]